MGSSPCTVRRTWTSPRPWPAWWTCCTSCPGLFPWCSPYTPRTLEAKRAGIEGKLRPGQRGLLCVPPQGYLDNLSLSRGARVVLTDSGGLQEEASVLRIPCLTMRDRTERPVTVTRGTSRLAGNDGEKIRAAFAEALAGDWPHGEDIPLWDGQAGPRIAAELRAWTA